MHPSDDHFAFEIPGRLPGMNEIIEAAKSHYGSYADMKKQHTETVAWTARAARIRRFERVAVTIYWTEPDARRDMDNICAGTKFILDGIVTAGVIPNDTRKHIESITHHFPDPDKKHPRITVVLRDAVNRV